MIPLYVYGSGGLGETIQEILAAGGLAGHTLAGWIDDERAPGTAGPGDVPVAGGREVLDRLTRADALLVAIGDNRTRLEFLRRARSRDVACPVAVHPTATLFTDVTLGPGSIVNAGAIVARHARLGMGGIVNLAATVGHDVVCGDAVQVSPGVNVAGGVQIGDGVFLGPGAVVIQGRRIDAWSRVGAGAVVIRDVEANTTVFGNPARVVERRAPEVS